MGGMLSKVVMVGFIQKVKFSQKLKGKKKKKKLKGDKSVVDSDIWRKNIPGKRNIQMKGLKIVEFLAKVRKSKEPAVIVGG